MEVPHHFLLSARVKNEDAEHREPRNNSYKNNIKYKLTTNITWNSIR